MKKTESSDKIYECDQCGTYFKWHERTGAAHRSIPIDDYNEKIVVVCSKTCKTNYDLR